jgi:hypothetical protein
MLDLDVIIEKKRTIKFMGRDVEIKNLTTEEYLTSQALGEEIVETKEGEDVIHLMASQLVKYVMLILDVTEDEARAMEYRQFRALKEYMSELDLMDQGFSPKEIEVMKKRAAKNMVEQAIQNAGSQ